MKILLAALNSKYVHTNIALRYLENMPLPEGIQCQREEFTVNEDLSWVLEKIMERRPKVVAFSVYIWNFSRVKTLITLLKALDGEMKILLGGPEATYGGEDLLLELQADYLIRGEGEKTFQEFCSALLGKVDMEKVRGLSYRQGDSVHHNPSREKMDLLEVPYPYGEGESLTGKIAYMEASRGCPYRCSYCLSSAERDLRFLPLPEILRRVEKLLLTGTRVVKFIDRTFNIHPEAVALWRHLIALDTEVTFHFEISPTLLTKEQLEVLATAPPGRIQMEVGIQSTTPQVLERIHRPMAFEKIRDRLLMLNGLKAIHTHMDLIAGLPGDTLENFRQSFNDVYALKPDMLQLGFLKVIPGTPLAKDAQRLGIFHSPEPPYEVLKTPGMGYEELRLLHHGEAVLDKYSNSGNFAAAMAYILQEDEDPFAFFMALGQAFKENGHLDRAPGTQEYYKILLHFALDYQKEKGHPLDPQVLLECLKYDWLKTSRKSFVPDFLPRHPLPKGGGKKVAAERFLVDVPAYLETGKVHFRDTFLIYDPNLGQFIPGPLSEA